MKLPADSVVLASADLGLVCLILLAWMMHIDIWLGASVIVFTVNPTILVLSVLFMIRDLIRPSTRRQGLIAAALLTPGILLLLAIKAP
jgi:hypothetical protein